MRTPLKLVTHSFPSFPRRGGAKRRGGYEGRVATLHKPRSAPYLFEFANHYYCFALSCSRFAPVCAARAAQARQRAASIKERDRLIDGAVTPPWKGGESPRRPQNDSNVPDIVRQTSISWVLEIGVSPHFSN